VKSSLPGTLSPHLSQAMTGGGHMIKDIFLTYANNSLKEDPAHLYKIFKIIEQNINIDLEGVEDAINLICELLKNNDSETILSLISEMLSGLGQLFFENDHFAYKAVTGDRHYYYLQLERYKDDPEFLEEWRLEKSTRACFKCEHRELNKKVLGEDLCEEYFDLKCYECHQLKFINFLNEIVQGKEYSEIEDIENILFYASIISSHTEDRTIQKLDQKAPFRETLQADDWFIYGYYNYIRSGHGNTSHAFNEYLNSIAYYSVTDFLLHNDRRNLKRCLICDDFIVTDHIKREVCSPPKDCENIRKKRWQKEYMKKKRDPDSPDFDPKYIR